MRRLDLSALTDDELNELEDLQGRLGDEQDLERARTKLSEEEFARLTTILSKVPDRPDSGAVS